MRVAALFVFIAGLLLAGCATVNVGAADGSARIQNFTGRLATVAGSTETRTPLVAFLVMPKDGGKDVRAYVCDGLDNGQVLWVRGLAQLVPKAGARAVSAVEYSFDLVSPTGFEISGRISEGAVTGNFTATGDGSNPASTRTFSCLLAPEGTGVYDLIVDEQGNVSGKSLTGDQLSLSKAAAPTASAGDGRPFSGTLTSADGAKTQVTQLDLSTVSPSDLASEGYPEALGAGIQGVEPGTYRAIVLLEGDDITSYGRLLLPGTGVNGIAPKFGQQRVSFTSAFRRGL